MNRNPGTMIPFLAVFAALVASSACGSDWPQWRYDAGRTARSPEQLPQELHLQWVRELPAPRPAWPASQHKLQFDLSYEPVVMGGTIFVPSMVSDSVTAYDTETGAEKWRYYAEAPVRFAPVAYRDKVWFVSDDGFLYCLRASDGTLVRKIRGGPDGRRVLGNDRLVGMWPARGAPVLYEEDGKATIYFGASIWPFMGIFIHAVDAETGRIVWTNSGSGSIWIRQQHGSPAFAGVAPHGYLAASSDKLLVSGGRTVPACYDRRTGEFLYYHVSSRQFGKGAGGYGVVIDGDSFYNGGAKYKLADGKGEDRSKDSHEPEAAGRKLGADGPWKSKVEGEIWSLLAADGKLFAVTRGGRLYCFGERRVEAKNYALDIQQPQAGMRSATANTILRDSDTTAGYCVVLGLGSGDLVESLIAQSKLHVIVIEADAHKVNAFRRKATDAGVYGTRVAAIVGNLATSGMPPYLAHLVVSEAPGEDMTEEEVAGVFRMLRPYGGAAYLGGDNVRAAAAFASTVPKDHARSSRAGNFTRLERVGALPGSAAWTHQYADAANSIVSKDKLVRAPLGLLWFGGPPNDPILPRHGHGPSPQVNGGRLFIEGQHMMRAVDVYTGRLLWERKLPEVGWYYRHTGHHPGANEIGTNYFSVDDGVYVNMPKSCIRLDPATGKTTKEYSLPARGEKNARWGFIFGTNELMIAATSPVVVPAEVRVVSRWTMWRYLAGSETPGGWATPSFSDAKWKKGRAPIGHGSEGLRTNLDKMRGKYTAVYLRTPFEIEDVGAIEKLYLVVKCDGKFVAHINGKEVLGVNADDESEYFEIGPQAVKSGKNVLAVEGHAKAGDNSKFMLNCTMFAVKRGAEGPVSDTGVASGLFEADYSSASRAITAIDRKTGRILWSREAASSFRHNTIVAGGGKVFCIDGLSSSKLIRLKRRGVTPDDRRTLYAIDEKTGRVVWKTEEDVFGTFMNYSEEHDILLQAGSAARDRARDESSDGMIAYSGRDGRILWKDLERGYGGPSMLHHDTIILQGSARSLLDGKFKTRRHPLTGAETPWGFSRAYGCNTAIASEHMILFRSAAAGYFDLERDSGTGNFGGFKSGCTSNLIAADGVLNAPDYTRTCSCSYQNQASLALIHMPDVETWHFMSTRKIEHAPVQRVGVNFGAAGNRKAASGTWWLPQPQVVSSPSHRFELKVSPDEVKYFRKHTSTCSGDELNWVACSGATGAASITLDLGPGPARKYDVTLVFIEPDDIPAARRVFDVSIQGRKVLEGLDIVGVAGGRDVSLVKRFSGVDVTKTLELTLTPSGGGSKPPVISGVEAVMSGQ